MERSRSIVSVETSEYNMEYCEKDCKSILLLVYMNYIHKVHIKFTVIYVYIYICMKGH